MQTTLSREQQQTRLDARDIYGPVLLHTILRPHMYIPLLSSNLH
jgi:hypothetical protein